VSAGGLAAAVTLTVAGVAAAVLAHAALGHAEHRAPLADAIAEHGVVPARRAPALATAVAVTEGLLAVALLAEALARPGRVAGTLVAAAALFLAFAAYLAVAGRRVSGPGVDCGCGALGGALTPTSWLRPAALAALPAAAVVVAALAPGAASGGPPGAVDVAWSWRLLAVAAAWVVTTALIALAEARAVSAAGLARGRHDHRLLVAAGPREGRG
jgi:Methylamine utilisation protein MauE